MFTDRVKIIPAVLKFPPQKKVTGMVTFDHFKEHLFLNEFHLLFTFRGGDAVGKLMMVKHSRGRHQLEVTQLPARMYILKLPFWQGGFIKVSFVTELGLKYFVP